MFRRDRGAGSPARGVAVVGAAAVIGAALLVFGGDRPLDDTARLETTHVAAAPLPLDTSTSSAPDGVATTTTATGVGPAALAALAALASTTTLPAAATLSSGIPATTTASPSAPASTVAAGTIAPATMPSPAPATTPTSTTTTSTSTTTTTTPAGPVRSRGAEADIVPLTNADRSAASLGALSRDSCLDGVASGYAEQMARRGALAHDPGAGAAVTGCKPGAAWGDNVGTSRPCSTSYLEEQWMASPSHRHNILTAGFRLIGIGAWTDDNGGCWVQVLFSS